MRSSTNRFLTFCAPLAAAAALAACGGGTAGVAPPAQVTTPAPPAAPTPTPSPYPSTDGTTFAYQGSYSQQYTLYGTPAPSPASPGVTPEPTSTPWTAVSKDTVAQQVTLHANATFNGTSGLTELDTNETDTGANAAYSVDSKQYLRFAPDSTRSNGTDLQQVALDASDSNGVKTAATFNAGNGVMDELPEVPAAQWTNTAARVSVENDPSGEVITNTYAADGTYTASSQFPEGTSAAITENADGSGVYELPFLATPGSEVTVAAAQNGAIALTFKDMAYGVASWGTVPLWYPLPLVLASDTFADAGTAAIPASCGVASSIGTQGTRIDEQRTRVDTVFGELEQTHQSSYIVPPYGAVCVVMHDDLQVYYDYSGQSSYLFSGTPLRETISDETLGMTKAPSTSARVRSLARGSSIAPFAVPSIDRVRLAVAKRHLQLMRHTFSVIKEVR